MFASALTLGLLVCAPNLVLGPAVGDLMAELAARLEERDRLAFASAWLPAVESKRAQVRGAWLATHDGYLRVDALDQELRWNRVAEGRELPRWQDFEAERHPFPVLIDFARQLEGRGIELVVAIAPTRLHTRPDLVLGPEAQLPADFAGFALGYQDFLAKLAGAGIEVIDLLPGLTALNSGEPGGAEAFLRYDSHWTPAAAEVAAELVHARLVELEAYEAGPLVCRATPDRIAFHTKESGLPRVPDPELLPIQRVRAETGAALEDKASPILAMGDSYVTYHEESESAFRHHLALRCGRALDVVSVFGRGSIGPRRALRRRRSHALGSKQIVVWLFSVTALAEPDQWLAIDYFGQPKRESEQDSE